MGKTSLIPAKHDPKCKKKYNENYDKVFGGRDKKEMPKPFKIKIKINGKEADS